MRPTPWLCLISCAIYNTYVCDAQTSLPGYSVNTFAGAFPVGDGGPGNTGLLRWPGALAFDGSGNLYIADQGSASVRVVTPDGSIHTVAGNGITGYGGDGGPANQAQLSAYLTGLAVNSNGDLYIADSGNNRIRMVSAADGTINTVVDGSMLPSPETQFGFFGIALDSAGNLYIADDTYSQIFRIAADGHSQSSRGAAPPAIPGTEDWRSRRPSSFHPVYMSILQGTFMWRTSLPTGFARSRPMA